jgi:hypothetical protein
VRVHFHENEFATETMNGTCAIGPRMRNAIMSCLLFQQAGVRMNLHLVAAMGGCSFF